LWRNLSTFITQTGLYCSKQLETTFHQFCEKPLHRPWKQSLGLGQGQSLALGSRIVFVMKRMQQSKKANGTNMVIIWIKCLTAFLQVGSALPRYGLALAWP